MVHKLLCAECVMRRRIAAIEATGSEPAPIGSGAPEVVGAETTLYGPVREAFTVIQGTAFCEEHLLEISQIQHVSAIVGANGQQLVVPPGAPR